MRIRESKAIHRYVIVVFIVAFLFSLSYGTLASSSGDKSSFLYHHLRRGSELLQEIDELSMIGQAEVMTVEQQEELYFKILSELQRDRGDWRYDVRIKVLSEHDNKAKMGVTIEAKATGLVEEQAFLQQRAKIYDIFRDLGSSPRLTTCLLGHLNGKLNKDDSERLLTQELRNLEARGQEVHWDGRCASASAYLPGLPESKLVGGVLVNIHTALRYHSHDGKTYVILASPVILGEY